MEHVKEAAVESVIICFHYRLPWPRPSSTDGSLYDAPGCDSNPKALCLTRLRTVQFYKQGAYCA